MKVLSDTSPELGGGMMAVILFLQVQLVVSKILFMTYAHLMQRN